MAKTFEWKKDGTIQEKIYYLTAYAKQIVKVDSHQKYSKVAASLRAIAFMIAEVQEDFQEGKTLAFDQHKAVCASENDLLAPLKVLDQELRLKMLVWRDYQDAVEKIEIAELLEANPNADLPPTKIPVLDGVDIRFEFVPLITHSELLPKDYMIPDMAGLKAFGRKTGGAGEIPGVVFQKTSKMFVSKSSNFEETS